MDWKLELIVVPASDVDRAKDFYVQKDDPARTGPRLGHLGLSSLRLRERQGCANHRCAWKTELRREPDKSMYSRRNR
jgi:hypothetical protein